MNAIRNCRTCLAKKAEKKLSDLECKGSNSRWPEIITFCLDIQVKENTEEGTKLCLKCFKKILEFYKFKLQAQKNDSLLKIKETKVKHEVFLTDDIKNEGKKANEDFDNYSLKESTQLHVEVKEEFNDCEIEECQSDDELLSVIQKIKYEFVADENFDETKENEPIKKKNGRKKKISNGKQVMRQVCEECGKTVRNLKEHIMLHKPAAVRTRVPCKLCDKTFATHSARYRHTQIKHLGIKKTCSLCNKVVVNIKQHTLVMHQSSQLQHVCVSCGRRFISQSALECHASIHTSNRPYSCDLCDKKFRTKIVMLQHKRQVHDKEKSHMCQYCSKSFFKKCHLQIHLRSHTKEKPYECVECGKFFSSTTILKNHRLLHNNVKAFNCSLCDMTFARPGYLRVHMISHTKIKKHPCKYCGVKFGRSDHRKRHEYTAHEKHLISSPTKTHLKDIEANGD